MRNLLACRTGDGYCDDSLLSPSEQKAVADVKRQRNGLACEVNDYSCDRSVSGNSSNRLTGSSGGGVTGKAGIRLSMSIQRD